MFIAEINTFLKIQKMRLSNFYTGKDWLYCNLLNVAQRFIG